MAKDKLTLQEHVNLGACLSIASRKLTERCCSIVPKTTARKSKEAKALKYIDDLRSLMEDIMFRDYGREGDNKFSKPAWWQDIYYGSAGSRKE